MGTASPLLISLIAYYKLDDTAWQDASGHGNDLTPTNTPTVAAGKVGNAASFVALSLQRLSHADTAELSGADVDITLACWVNLASKTTYRPFVSKSSSSTNKDMEYSLYYDQGADRFHLTVGNGVSAGEVNGLSSPSLSTWYYIVAWHDSTLNTVNIQVNDGSINVAAWTGGSFDGSGLLRIGDWNGLVYFMDGLIDEVSIWRRLLTIAERTQLYGGGNGLSYPF